MMLHFPKLPIPFLMLALVALLPGSVAHGQTKVEQLKPPVYVTSSGRLGYEAGKSGDRLPDFSYAGYMAGDEAIPEVPIRIVVPINPTEEDATLRIQAAIDYVGALPADTSGIRGAVLLERGLYRLAGQLRISGSGIVLRGSGMQKDGTVLLAEGNSRETLIVISGKDDRRKNQPVNLVGAYVPVNAMSVTVAGAHTFKAGDKIVIERPSTKEWISDIEMETLGGDDTWLGWKPGYHTIGWNRKITEVRNNTLLLDAPLTTAIDSAYGGGTVAGYSWPGLITQSGVENMLCRSTYDSTNLKDENHRWMAITMDNVEDCWVRRIIVQHFAGSAVYVSDNCRRVTVEDCISLAPVSEIAAQRRHTFFTGGQQTLFQRLYSEYGYHDFGAGYCAAGPNAFVQCESYLPIAHSGALESWASGLLLDNVKVDGGVLGFPNRGALGQGTGWTAANSVVWQCSAARIDLPAPPTATNWAFGTWARSNGNGQWFESDSYIKPVSLYYAQLSDRKGVNITERALLLPIDAQAPAIRSNKTQDGITTSSTTGSPAAMELKEWIEKVVLDHPLDIDRKTIITIDELGFRTPSTKYKTAPAQIINGWLTRGQLVLTGSRQHVFWWRGNIRPPGIKAATDHITRFVPGRTGKGVTDDLNEVTDSMLAKHVIAIDHNYGLWYERRRDDHLRVRRMDGDVWPPFYELPFARSGHGTAWDGLSKYDLTKYNPWYWRRLNEFAHLADQKGLVLIHQQYFQHNILEAGAHYADFPWRTANNINNTPFPEPPLYNGGKWIRMADQFYDTTNTAYRELHKAYIRKCLDNFDEGAGVVHMISAEYTGPLHFVQFWADVISNWENEKGKQALIGLSATKDVQDAILADELRSKVIDVIDIRYWTYNPDGKIYAPEGGVSMAPRQYLRKDYSTTRSETVPPGTPFQQVYRAVKDYRTSYPGKAVIYSANGYEKFGWAVFMAGGSLAVLPPIEDAQFLKEASLMQPATDTTQPDNLVLEEKGRRYIVYTHTGTAHLDLQGYTSRFRVVWMDPATGRKKGSSQVIKGGKSIRLKSPDNNAWILWVRAIK